MLSEAKEFNKPQINTTECRKIIAKIFYLLYNGEKLTPSEATELFFSITKLFRSKNVSFHSKRRDLTQRSTSELLRICTHGLVTNLTTTIGEPEADGLCPHKGTRWDSSGCDNCRL